MYFECTAAAGGRAGGLQKGQAESCALWQWQPAIVMLSVASLVGSDVAAVGSVGGG